MGVQPVDTGDPEEAKDHLLQRRLCICCTQNGALPVDRLFVEDITTGISRPRKYTRHHPLPKGLVSWGSNVWSEEAGGNWFQIEQLATPFTAFLAEARGRRAARRATTAASFCPSTGCSGPQLRDTALPVMRRLGAAQAAPL
jgi:hypothetical protein